VPIIRPWSRMERRVMKGCARIICNCRCLSFRFRGATGSPSSGERMPFSTHDNGIWTRRRPCAAGKCGNSCAFLSHLAIVYRAPPIHGRASRTSVSKYVSLVRRIHRPSYLPFFFFFSFPFHPRAFRWIQSNAESKLMRQDRYA